MTIAPGVPVCVTGGSDHVRSSAHAGALPDGATSPSAAGLSAAARSARWLGGQQDGELLSMPEFGALRFSLQIKKGADHLGKPEPVHLHDHWICQHARVSSVVVAGIAGNCSGSARARPVRPLARMPIETMLQDPLDRGVGARTDVEPARAAQCHNAVLSAGCRSRRGSLVGIWWALPSPEVAIDVRCRTAKEIRPDGR